MKLQIVEYSVPNLLEGNIHHRYMLILDERVIRWTGSSASKRELKEVYSLLMNDLLSDGIKDINLENYPTFDFTMIHGCEKEVIFEQEVSDKFLKEMFVASRIKELEEDFK